MTKNETKELNEIETAETIKAMELHTALNAVEITAVPTMSTDRHIPRKEQAKLARQLFKQLGLKGISVTAPNYSMAQSVDVRMPKRCDYVMSGYDVIDGDVAREANNSANHKMRLILDAAFPNHDNRSDSQSDYFDFCWSMN